MKEEIKYRAALLVLAVLALLVGIAIFSPAPATKSATKPATTVTAPAVTAQP